MQGLGLPQAFAAQVWDFILDQDETNDTWFQVSCLELVALLHGTDEFVLPAISPLDGRWIDASEVVYQPGRLTLAVQLRLVRKTVLAMVRAASLQAFWSEDLDRVSVGVFRPVDGLAFQVCAQRLLEARSLLQSFTARRPIRTTADLSRPFG